MKKWIAMILAAVLLLSCCGCGEKAAEETIPQDVEAVQEATEAAAAEAATEALDEFAHINELEPVNGVYQIVSEKGLANMAQHPDGKFKLLCDIDLGGASWTPVGTQDKPFTGKLDGDEFTISNFRLDTPDADGNLGFLGVNQGEVVYLNLADVQIVPNTQTSCLGGIAARNEGSLEGVTVTGTMAEGQFAPQAVVGGAVGVNTGTVRNNCVAAVDMKLNVPADMTLGGIAGKCEDGKLAYSDAAGRMELTGNGKAGLLVGAATAKAEVDSCKYAGAMNTLGGEFYNVLIAESEEGFVAANCLYRDNTNSDEFLTAESMALRTEAVEYMRAMAEVIWTVPEVYNYTCSDGNAYCSQMFLPTDIMQGLPYTHKQGSLERLQYVQDENGCVQSWINGIGYDGFDMYMGNDCSGAVYWAWARVASSFEFQWTWGMLPSTDMGVLPVGDYDAYVEQTTDVHESIPVVEANGEERILEAYAKLNKGDAIVAYYTGGNHARLCSAGAVVFRDAEGKIDPVASYITSIEQGAARSMNPYITTWRVDYKYTFAQLYEKYYLPVTVQELVDGKSETPAAQMVSGGEGKLGLFTGTVESNYRINCVTIDVKDAEGNDFWNHSIFAGVSKYDTEGTDLPMRRVIREFDMAQFSPVLQNVTFEKGASYSYTITVLLSSGDTFTLTESSFVNGQ